MWGTASIDRLCRHARQLGYGSLALTDTDNLYGLWPFLHACRREGLTPIVGAEITDPATRGRAVCLVENTIGYRHLCQLITHRHTHPAFSLRTALPEFADGLIILTSHATLLTHWHEAGIQVAAAMPRRAVSAKHALAQTARQRGIDLVATPGAFFLHPSEHRIHCLLRAVAGRTVLSRLGRTDLAPADAWLAGPDIYDQRFAVYPQAIRNTDILARRITFSGPSSTMVMPPWQDAHGRPAGACLRQAALDGARRRYGARLPAAVVTRLEHELTIIDKMGFSAYFLVVRDIVRHSSRTCGRGSGAASLVAYCLNITDVCPVAHNLYFERFLNPGRRDPPDIDVDFAWDERDAILAGVLRKYHGHSAMVANHVCFQPRMAVRETARVFGLADGEISRICKRMPWRLKAAPNGFDQALQQEPTLKNADFADPWPDILSLAGQLVGIPRHLSVHPGGVIITPGAIDQYVPIEHAPKGIPIIQWEKDGAEDAGLVKIDLLGNRSLGVIRDAMAQVRSHGGRIDTDRWRPETDPETCQALAQGRTMGCFYIESPAMRQLQIKSGRGDFNHLVIHSSIIRPAANKLIQEYLRRLHGATWEPIHPLLENVLDETYGIMVYQEDVAKAAVAIAGFSHAEADGLRKILSKKDREYRLRDAYRRFYRGARANGLAKDQIGQIWQMMMSFDGYSFCKPHSASYARVSFQAAWLKVHFPAEFMAAVISNRGGFYGTLAYVSEARRMGLQIDPPDVNHSNIRWRGCKQRIRVGLDAIGGLSRTTQDKIVNCRAHTPYRQLADFLSRVKPDEAECRALIDCGALDGLDTAGCRNALAWQVAHGRMQARQTAQPTLFTPLAAPPPDLPPQPPAMRLQREFATLGFLCHAHPLHLYRRFLADVSVTPVADLDGHVNRQVQIAGWLIAGKTVRTRHGDAMKFLTFEDETERIETTFFPQTYQRCCHLLDYGRPYLLRGRVERDLGAISLNVHAIEPIGISQNPVHVFIGRKESSSPQAIADITLTSQNVD